MKRFLDDEQGADLIEYALLAGLISLAAVGTLTTVGTNVTALWKKISDSVVAATAKIQ